MALGHPRALIKKCRGFEEGREIHRHKLRAEAFELRKAGATYEEIGRSLGITAQSAHETVTRALKASVEASSRDAASIRALELERLDSLLKGLWPAASKGNPASVEKVLKIMERRARLLGLDAPVKHSATDPTGEHERTLAVWALPPEMSLEEWQKAAAAAVSSP
jgi:hypothetical protein